MLDLRNLKLYYILGNVLCKIVFISLNLKQTGIKRYIQNITGVLDISVSIYSTWEQYKKSTELHGPSKTDRRNWPLEMLNIGLRVQQRNGPNDPQTDNV